MTNMQTIKIPNLDNTEFTFTSLLELKPNKPFSDELFDQKGVISLTSIKAEASKSFSLSKGSKKIDFSGKVEGFSALGVFRKADALSETLKAEGMSEPIANLLNLQIADDENLIAIRWGYNLEAAVEGKVALAANPINITLGADGKKSGLYTLLHIRKRNENVIDSITETLKSWRIPRQIETADNLNPKTTIAMETFGSLKMSLGVQYGYNYNWIKDEIKIGNLSGEFGAKINASINAQFGYEATGRFAVALSRESDEKKVRLQVFKLKQNGMSFAFNGGVSGQFEAPDIPEKLDAFIKGVFNLNGSQVLKDFEKWADPDTKIEELLSDKLEGEAKKLIKAVTGIDPDQALDDAVKKLKDLIEIWHELPNKINTLIYDLLPADLSELNDFLSEVIAFSGSNEQNSKNITKEIEKHLEDVEFYSTPIGKWITEVADGEITSLLANFDKERTQFIKISKQTLALLDGGEVEERLRNFQNYIDEKLNLDKIDDLANIDDWLKQRLVDFLGKTLNNNDIKEIRGAIKKLRDKADEFYKIGYDALTKKYGAEINYKFQKSTSSDSLIDLTFDFDIGSVNTLKTQLKNALDGDFNELLSKNVNGITLNAATLTHGINRSSHLEITLPFSHAVVKHINRSMADGKIVEEANGRLWLFTLRSEDSISKGDRLSKLAITAEFSTEFEDSDIRRFEEESFTINHDFLYADRDAERLSLEKRFEPAVQEYFKSDIPSFSKYLTAIDIAMEKVGVLGTNDIGSTFVSLDLGLDGRVLSAWKNLPKNYNNNVYKEISSIIQKRLREWIPFAYIQEAKKYDDIDVIYPLLVYQLLPSFDKLVKPRHITKINTHVYHWDYAEPNNRKEAFEQHCKIPLQDNVFPKIAEIVSASSLSEKDKKKIIKKYTDVSFDEVKKKGTGENLNVLGKLERKVIEKFVEVAQLFNAFLEENDKKKKIEALAKFGSEFTETFNDRLGHIFYTPKGALRPLGLILISDIAKVLDPNIENVKLSAILDTFVLKSDSSNDEFKQMKDKFLNGEYPITKETKELIAIHHRVINKESKFV